jgi:quinol---cytochrome-c reductase cytochrome c subunit
MRLALVLLVALVLAAPAGAGGEELFGRWCASCHGPDARGTDRGPSLRGVGARAAHFYLSTGYMPLQEPGVQPRRTHPLLLGPREIDELIGYVASLGGPAIPRPHPERGNVAEGMRLFRSNCAGCHQIVAQGGYVTDATPPPLADSTPVQIAEAVRIGPYVMPTFSLTDAEVDSIIRYVEYTKHPDNRGGWALGNVGPIPEGLVAWFLAGTVLIGVCLVIGRRLRA